MESNQKNERQIMNKSSILHIIETVKRLSNLVSWLISHAQHKRLQPQHKAHNFSDEKKI